MQLIDEIEIAYFRSFYKFKLRNLTDLNIIFGKNDSGKSNVVRALNLFFSGTPELAQPMDFPVDFCEQRQDEAEASEGVRKFLYVKITFNTPPSFQRSLGKSFYVKRQWTVSRGQDYHEEMSNNISSNKSHIATRLLNKISFIYIPAIKDIRIFEMLLSRIHETVALAPPFQNAVEDFSDKLHDLTRDMFNSLPKEVATSTKIGTPTRLSQLFETLDFETIASGEKNPKSLTRQRGDGIKVRHIPELLSFISERDKFDFHIWGFEEPENSLDFAAAQSEALRLLALARSDRVQVFMTTHSPSFYLLEDSEPHRVCRRLQLLRKWSHYDKTPTAHPSICWKIAPTASKYYITKTEHGLSEPIQGRNLKHFDAQQALGVEGFYLPVVAEALTNVALLEARAKDAESRVHELMVELQQIAAPVVLTEGRTDAAILRKAAWEKRRGGDPHFHIRSCETGGENAGAGDGGAVRLAGRLKGVAGDHPHAVIGIFDLDQEGVSAYKLDKNFVEMEVGGFSFKRGMHGQAYAAFLPAPEFREECKEYCNLPIEFLFRDEHLAEMVDGMSLTLKRKKASTKVGIKKIEKLLDDVTHFKEVGDGKTDFANVIVPTLDADAFDAFDDVFAMIDQIIVYNIGAM